MPSRHTRRGTGDRVAGLGFVCDRNPATRDGRRRRVVGLRRDAGDRAVGRAAARCRHRHASCSSAGIGSARSSDACERRPTALDPPRGLRRSGHELLAPGSRELAAILACGPGAVVSHESAAHLHQLLPHPARPGPVHVSRPRETQRPQARDPSPPRPRLRAGRDRHPRHGIPITSPARTILDLAPTRRPADLEQARRRGPPQAPRHAVQALRALIARYPRRPGHRRCGPSSTEDDLRPSPARRPSAASSRCPQSEASRPRPSTRRSQASRSTSSGRDQRVVVEVDGYGFHSTRPDRRRDHARDASCSGSATRCCVSTGTRSQQPEEPWRRSPAPWLALLAELDPLDDLGLDRAVAGAGRGAPRSRRPRPCRR